MLKRVLAAAAAAAMLAAAGLAGSEGQAPLEGIDGYIEEVMQEWKVPGLSVAAVHEGRIVISKGYGYRNLENRKPVTQNTLFAVGSNTKSLTAALMGILVDEGVLEWDKPIREYLPGFRLHDTVATAQMTPRDLLTHRSGLPRHDLVWYGSGRTREDLYQRLRFLQPSKPFRSAYQYQNLMFMTAGYLQQRVTGVQWEELAQRRVLSPLGMTRSNLSVDAMRRDDDFSYPYALHKGQARRVPFRNIDEVGPAGSLNSSAAEMIRYIQFHLNLGQHEGRTILSKANSQEMQKPQMPITGPIAARTARHPEMGDPSYGLGLIVSSYRGRKIVQHGGGIDGFISQMSWLPEEKMGTVVLTNLSGDNPLPSLVTKEIFDRLLELPDIDWVKRQRQLRDRAAKNRQAARKKSQSERKSGTSPTHGLEELAGSYEHPAYGPAVVRSSASGLTIEVVGFSLPMEHYHYNIFTVTRDLPPPLGSFGGMMARFHYDKRGEIDRLSMTLESAVDEIDFSRLPDADLTQPEFLETLAGSYRFEGATAVVEFEEKRGLTLSVPGQPVHTLLPDRDSKFRLKGLEGFFIEFILDEAGAVSKLVSHQPNGSFEAKRLASSQRRPQ